MKGQCKVCDEPGAAEIVDKLLGQKVFLREIGKQTGLTKSAIHRHSQRCFIRAATEALKSRSVNFAKMRCLIQWPGAQLFNWDAQSIRPIAESEITERDVILMPVYAPAPAIPEPAPDPAEAVAATPVQ